MIIIKRDILIFPKFKNINLIQDIRKDYDRLVNLIPPHITLVFPFTDYIANDDLIKKIKECVKDIKPFKIKFKGVLLNNQNFIFLNCVYGNEEIINLHNKIYNEVLPTHLNKSVIYTPHITLGKANNIDFLKNFEYEFEDIVDQIVIEEIGSNEESIIIGKINLN